MLPQRYGEGMSPAQLGELTKRFVAELAKRSDKEAQAILSNNVEWHIGAMLDNLGDFRCDWVKSDLGYPTSYKGLLPLTEQVELLAKQFRLDRGPAMKLLKKPLPDVPKWAEGWAAVPIPEKFPDGYAGITEKALIWHCTVRGHPPGCYAASALGGLMLGQHIQPHFVGPEMEKRNCTRNRFAEAWGRNVGGRIMIVPVQMGDMRKGQSDRMVKACCERKKSEFPLGAFEVACLLAMHPTRVPGHDEKALGVNAPGDEYNPAAVLKTMGNCRWLQMGKFWCLRRGEVPTFVLGSEQLREACNGPITASSWDIKAHVESLTS